MGSSEFVIFISILASNIAKGKSEDEINLLSTFFSQLGDTLATISAFDSKISRNFSAYFCLIYQNKGIIILLEIFKNRGVYFEKTIY